MTNETRSQQISEKLKKMFKGSEIHKDNIVKELKSWLKNNHDTDKVKFDTIQSFLADNNIF